MIETTAQDGPGAFIGSGDEAIRWCMATIMAPK